MKSWKRRKGYNPFSAICRSKARRRGSDLTLALRGEPPRCLSRFRARPVRSASFAEQAHKTSNVFRYGSRKELTRARSPRHYAPSPWKLLPGLEKFRRNRSCPAFNGQTSSSFCSFMRPHSSPFHPFFISYSIFFSPITVGKF